MGDCFLIGLGLVRMIDDELVAYAERSYCHVDGRGGAAMYRVTEKKAAS
jgi:hypothetical protein